MKLACCGNRHIQADSFCKKIAEAIFIKLNHRKKIYMIVDMMTEGQIRGLFATLRLFDQSLSKAANLLSKENDDEILSYKISRLTSYQKSELLNRIKIIQNKLVEFSRKIPLDPVEESLDSLIVAEMSMSWQNLEECRSSRLRAYGEVHPMVAKEIDSAIDYFARSAMEIVNLVKPNPAGGEENYV